MENTFPTFRNPYYEAPLPHYYYSQAPSSGALFTPNTQSVSVRQLARPSQPHPKVVSIPVHFVGTEKSRSAAAVKIQKVFRGFLVKTAVKKVLRIAAEVAEIERRVARKETVEMVRREEKERLRLNEMLMSLLFRLDSISGFDSGVRDCRKTVIKRVIALQERLDACGR
ncbi:BAG family molecular chaperone regulator 5, mitochondrial-like [Aristolochia californica]|uniref:BAG family molecular chaperone regulator 5, mitochondrial-like n=1 Tax=Aristolochia californica TaxID=171875 RepID=UPI0035E0EDDF